MHHEQMIVRNRSKQILISLEEAKHYLRIEPENSDDDEIIITIMEAAIQAAEKYLGFCLTIHEIEQLQQDFYGGIIELKYRPVIALQHVFIWQNNAKESLSYESYYYNFRLDRVELRTALIGGNIGIAYKAGYENPKLIDEPIKLGALNHVASLYDDRHLSTLPRASIALYAPYRRVRLI